MCTVGVDSPLIVFLSLWSQLYYSSTEFSQLSLLRTFKFASMAFTFVTILLLAFTLKSVSFMLYLLYHASLSLSLDFASVICTFSLTFTSVFLWSWQCRIKSKGLICTVLKVSSNAFSCTTLFYP